MCVISEANTVTRLLKEPAPVLKSGIRYRNRFFQALVGIELGLAVAFRSIHIMK